MSNNLVNARISVERYIRDNFSETSVRYEGIQGFNTETEDEWIEPVVLGLTGHASRRRTYVHERYILNVNCFSRIDKTSSDSNRKNIRRVDAIVDAVMSAFRQKSINYQNAAGTNLGWLRFEEPEVTNLRETSESLKAKNVSIEMALIREV